MHEFLPVLIVGSIIGAVAIVFVIAGMALKKYSKEEDGHDRKMSDAELIQRLLSYAKPYWKQFVYCVYP